ncbi:MAG: NAD(P)H-dependent oxidoreductase subunit E [Gemmataceae bacterium]|nr:NAD(P)H-dependent oxidoreductase subunit E [Gemmataceae bacterium]
MIVQRLREIQNRHGYLPDAELHTLARETGVPLYRIEEVSTFFPAFRPERDRPADLEVRVCRDYTCHLRGAADLLDPTKGLPRLERELAAALAKATGHGPCRVAVSGVSCLGRCDRAPAVWVERHRPPMGEHEHAWVYAGLTPDELEQVLREVATGGRPEPHWDAAHEPPSNAPYAEVVPDAPRAAGWEIDPYARDGRPRDYAAVRRVVESLTAGRPPVPPRGLPAKELDGWVDANYRPLAEMRASGLLGMGGAGAPAYGKWLDVWQQAGPEKYVVVNGDESEPGTFKDRELLLRTPHLIVEGLIVACLITGATAGYVYIRHEYPEQIAAVRAEIARAEALGACGEDVFGTGRPLPLAVFESPGGYICGEQSALLEAMEDRRAQPRNRPPELGANGLRDKPTAVNNVETIAWAPFIQLRGGAGYAGGGWRVPGRPDLGFGGRRLFSVSGDVRRPGVYEVPVGLPLGDLLGRPEYCGGVVGGPLKAVAPSGPSCGLLPARLPVDAKFREQVDDRVKRIGERSAADAAFARWFVDAHLPPGAADLDVLALPLDLTFFRNLQGLIRLPVEPMLGAGLAVYAGAADALDHAVNFTEFYRNESCGKCVPCRLGSQKLVQIGTDLLRRRADGTGPDLPGLVKDITATLQQTSICGLGYVAPIPLATALAYFTSDVNIQRGNHG